MLWIFLTLLLAFGIYLFVVAIPAKKGQTITLSFHDANEISKGSAVRMMGTDIGFVDDVRIMQDHVEIKIQTYPGTLKIPSGARFTILFTGLAGAKSIEVDLPTTPQPQLNGHPIYLVEEPIRMKDTLNSSIDVTQALQKGAENITDFFGKKKPVEELQFNIREAHQMSAVAAKHAQSANGAVQDLNQQIRDNSRQAIGTLDDLDHGTEKLVSMTQPVKLRRSYTQFVNLLNRFTRLFKAQTGNAVNLVTVPKRLTQLNQANGQAAYQLKRLNTNMQQHPLGKWLKTFSNGQGQYDQFLTKADQFFAKDHMPALQHARQAIQSFNHKLQILNVKLTTAQQQAANSSKKP